jgi:hypothetical protein
MSRKVKNIRRAGAYVVKSAESRSSRVPAKTSEVMRPSPSVDDKHLVEALRRTKAREGAA